MPRDLIFDLGMHRGEDTDFYLKKGFRVVGVEAHPELARHCRRRFADYIADGSLHVIEGAIVGRERLQHGPVKFYANAKSVWGTIDPQWRDRNAVQFGFPSTEIEVGCVDLGAILAEHGVPYYMKIDLEGADRFCLDYLDGLQEKPDFISMEADKVDLAALMQDMEKLWALGYRKFSAVQQETIGNSTHRGADRSGKPLTHLFPVDASGEFGPDLNSWMTREEIAVEYRWIFEMYRIFGDNSPMSQEPNLNQLRLKLAHHFQRCLPGWYDTHAAL